MVIEAGCEVGQLRAQRNPLDTLKPAACLQISLVCNAHETLKTTCGSTICCAVATNLLNVCALLNRPGRFSLRLKFVLEIRDFTWTASYTTDSGMQHAKPEQQH